MKITVEWDSEEQEWVVTDYTGGITRWRMVDGALEEVRDLMTGRRR